MNPDKEVQDLAVSLTVASAQLLARLQAPPAANGSRHLHRHLDRLSQILEDLEHVILSADGDADVESEQECADDDEQVRCASCDLPIPAARQEAIPGTRYCVSCADDMEKHHVEPFESATETDARRYWRNHERNLEGDRLLARPRRRRSSKPSTEK